MQASAGDQVKGRMIDLQTSSEKKKEEVDRLIDTEIDIAYKKAKSMLENESERSVFLESRAMGHDYGFFSIGF